MLAQSKARQTGHVVEQLRFTICPNWRYAANNRVFECREVCLNLLRQSQSAVHIDLKNCTHGFPSFGNPAPHPETKKQSGRNNKKRDCLKLARPRRSKVPKDPKDFILDLERYALHVGKPNGGNTKGSVQTNRTNIRLALEQPRRRVSPNRDPPPTKAKWFPLWRAFKTSPRGAQ